MRRLRERGEAAARKQQRQRIERIVAALEAAVPRAAVKATEAGVTVSGKGLARQWFSDPALRFAGRLAK